MGSRISDHRRLCAWWDGPGLEAGFGGVEHPRQLEIPPRRAKWSFGFAQDRLCSDSISSPKAGFERFVALNSSTKMGTDLCNTILRLNDLQEFFRASFPGVWPLRRFQHFADDRAMDFRQSVRGRGMPLKRGSRGGSQRATWDPKHAHPSSRPR
jgi:hypothetical protein